MHAGRRIVIATLGRPERLVAHDDRWLVATMECFWSCAVSSASVGLRCPMAQVGHAVAHVRIRCSARALQAARPRRPPARPTCAASTQRRQSALRLRTEMQRSCTAMASLSISGNRASRPLIRDMAYPLSGIVVDGQRRRLRLLLRRQRNVMARSGHTSAPRAALLQSLSVVSPATRHRAGLMPSGHACSHRCRPCRDPRAGTSRRPPGAERPVDPLNSESNAPNGQKRWHHFGSSRISQRDDGWGRRLTVHVEVTERVNRRARPAAIGGEREADRADRHTGKLKTSVVSNAAARMP